MTNARRLVLVVPTLDEAASLPRCLERARAECDAVVVSDGGSRDETPTIARRLGAHWVAGPPGRGAQLDRGGEVALEQLDADILLFLHADTLLAPGAGAAIRDAVESGAVGGGFHVLWDHPRPIYRLAERLVRLRSRLSRCPLGDQAQFVRADIYRQLGGFRPWPVLEDLDLARRLRRLGPVALLEPPVTTSPRRYERLGVLRTIALNWTIWALYFFGVSPQRLGRLYGRHETSDSTEPPPTTIDSPKRVD
ncbi:MAG: TIGR04283 family arsenosugar biosynthesis glycosyltransferase [Acidobacteriota bacterium]